MTTESSSLKDGGRQQLKGLVKFSANGIDHDVQQSVSPEDEVQLQRKQLRAVMKLFIRRMLDSDSSNGQVKRAGT